MLHAPGSAERAGMMRLFPATISSYSVGFTVCRTLGKRGRVKSCVPFSELIVEIRRICMNKDRDSTSVSERVKEGSGPLD